MGNQNAFCIGLILGSISGYLWGMLLYKAFQSMWMARDGNIANAQECVARQVWFNWCMENGLENAATDEAAQIMIKQVLRTRAEWIRTHPDLGENERDLLDDFIFIPRNPNKEARWTNS